MTQNCVQKAYVEPVKPMQPPKTRSTRDTPARRSQRVSRRPCEATRRRLDAGNIRYINLLEAMTRQPGHYFPNGGEVHFNANGHAFAARQLAPVVDSLLLNP